MNTLPPLPPAIRLSALGPGMKREAAAPENEGFDALLGIIAEQPEEDAPEDSEEAAEEAIAAPPQPALTSEARQDSTGLLPALCALMAPPPEAEQPTPAAVECETADAPQLASPALAPQLKLPDLGPPEEKPVRETGLPDPPPEPREAEPLAKPTLPQMQQGAAAPPPPQPRAIALQGAAPRDAASPPEPPAPGRKAEAPAPAPGSTPVSFLMRDTPPAPSDTAAEPPLEADADADAGGQQETASAPETPPRSDLALVTAISPAQPEEAAPTPALQIISQVASLAKPVETAAPAVSTAAAKPLRPTESPIIPYTEVKALRIRLQPEALGEVEVILRRAGHETKVTIAVAEPAAVDSLRRDMSLLEDRLGGLLAPGSAQVVTVALQAAEPKPSTDTASQQGANPFTGADATASGGRGSAREEKQAPQGQQPAWTTTTKDRNEEDRPARRPAAADRARVV